MATIKELHKSDWMKNIDTTGESAKVVWWPIIADERFSEEKIGTYEGAYTDTQGVWRPTENSMMNANDCPFNAPSRKVIYDKIRYLGENAPASSFEEFVVFDTAHKPEQWDYTTRASQAQAGTTRHKDPLKQNESCRLFTGGSKLYTIHFSLLITLQAQPDTCWSTRTAAGR